MEEYLVDIESGLYSIFEAIGDGVVQISKSISTASTKETGTSNTFGDSQLEADMVTQTILMESFGKCKDVAVVSSEESPSDTVLSENGKYSVAFDPLDGSSIIPSNFSVGSIFGIWKGKGFIGKSGKDMVGAAYAVYGPRTVMVVAYGGMSGVKQVMELCLDEDKTWKVSKKDLKIAKSKKLFAPANLRSSKDNKEYAAMMQYWMQEQYTLRYTGGMVPDIHNLMIKGGGVFCNPVSESSPAKLRVLYECLPLSYVMCAAGGESIDGCGEMLHHQVLHHDERSSICLGSKEEVRMCQKAMRQFND